MILIPNYEKKIFVNGEFKNNRIYEVKDGENLIIKYSGGISSFESKKNCSLKEIMVYLEK